MEIEKSIAIDPVAFEKALAAHCDDASNQMIAWTKEVSGKPPEIALPFILNPRSALQAAIEAYEAARGTGTEQPVDCRDEFEAACLKNGWPTHKEDRSEELGGPCDPYIDDHTASAWLGWQECWRRLSPLKREFSELRTVMNTALGVILNYRDQMPQHIVRWAESKVDLTDAEVIEDEEEQGRRG